MTRMEYGATGDETLVEEAAARPRRMIGASLMTCALVLISMAALSQHDPMSTRVSELRINEANIDDAMTADCVSKSDAAAAIETLGGMMLQWKRLPNPAGAAFLMDRGAWGQLRSGALTDYDWEYGELSSDFPYDYDQQYKRVAKTLEDTVRTTTFSARTAPTYEEGCDLTASSSTGCTESCLEEAFKAYNGGVFASCNDPVEAAFLLTPDLVAECVDAESGSACFQCVSSCIGQSRAVFLNCGARDVETPHHDAPDATKNSNVL